VLAPAQPAAPLGRGKQRGLRDGHASR
jgi:hypothetical protein